MPSGLSLNSATGVISGTLGNGQGKFDFAITAKDSLGASYTKYMAFVILAPPVTAPYISPYSSFNQLDDCTIGNGCSRGFNVWNGGTPPFTWSATGLPPGMGFRTGDGVTASYI